MLHFSCLLFESEKDGVLMEEIGVEVEKMVRVLDDASLFLVPFPST